MIINPNPIDLELHCDNCHKILEIVNSSPGISEEGFLTIRVRPCECILSEPDVGEGYRFYHEK